MRMFLKGAVAMLALAGTALATAGTASADDYRAHDDYYRAHDDYRAHDGYRSVYGAHRDNAVIAIGIDDIAFAYRDGYWDTGHRWHRWRNSHDYWTYRDQDGGKFHNGIHDRYRNGGWMRHR